MAVDRLCDGADTKKKKVHRYRQEVKLVPLIALLVAFLHIIVQALMQLYICSASGSGTEEKLMFPKSMQHPFTVNVGFSHLPTGCFSKLYYWAVVAKGTMSVRKVGLQFWCPCYSVEQTGGHTNEHK